MWMANLLHPEVFHYDLRAEMKNAYKTLYHYDLADADIDGVLWTAQQGDAANYDQFKVRQE
jgi:iron complex transport system substrate-binding protein